MLIEPFTLFFGRVVPTIVVAGKHSSTFLIASPLQCERIEATH
jgi:hypothetical protein